MYIQHNTWEYTAEVKNGVYILKKADSETCIKQLKEQNKQRKRELENESHKIII